MHEHKWELVKQQFDRGIDRMVYTCVECGRGKTTEYDLIKEEYVHDATD